MKIICLTVGKKHDPDLRSAIQKYEDRLKRYSDFSFQLIAPSEKLAESAAILRSLKDDDFVILLDETGDLINNQELTGKIKELQQKSVKRLVFIIGGAYGVDQSVVERAQLVCALSGLVFPHQLVRLILAEQLYRTFNTLAGGKYHHD